MSRLRTHVIPLILVTLAGLAAVVILRDEPPAGWLRVQASPSATIGQPFVATVTLLEPIDGVFLDFDLHGEDVRRHPLRCVAASPTQKVASQQNDYVFTLIVPDRPDLDRVHAVIYLSRTGQWSDHFRVAKSGPILFVRSDTAPPHAAAVPLEVHESIPDPEIEVSNPRAARALIALTWLLGAGMAAIEWHRRPPPRHWPLVALACVAIAVVEATSAGTALADLSRTIAREAGLYEDRRTFQQVMTAAFVGIFGLLAAIGLRRSRRQMPALALAGMALYAAATLAGMLSLHEVDRVLAGGIGPWSLAVVLRLTGACAAAVGSAIRLRKR